MTTPQAPSKRTTVRRAPDRAAYDRETIHAILDEALVAHVGFSVDDQPFVIPMVFGRRDDTLYLHGASASRLVRMLAGGVSVSATFTLIDGLVMARSAFHHSMNYRSVVVVGQARLVEDAEERLAALRAIVDQIHPDRWEQVRRPNVKELARTYVLALPLDETSAKQRKGDPVDDEEDYALDVWAGVIPVRSVYDEPLDDARLREDTPAPELATRYDRKFERNE
jgi:nitroimidazol reductase NimA-like FMN-containing flavoprotein (pyridoxamine 5'-phosphate oxidase superfamily)